MRSRRRVAAVGAALLALALAAAAAGPLQLDAALVTELVERPWSARALMSNPGQWARQVSCRAQQRRLGSSSYTVACVCSGVNRSSRGAGFWSAEPGCNPQGQPGGRSPGGGRAP